jgi:shikimate dehydrogenase
MQTPPHTDQVSFLNGRTRLYGIVGDPIEQVRSPEMITWE